MDLREIITTRRSVRVYAPAAVPGETVRDLVALGTHAPTGSNMQPWGFAVVEDREFLRRWSERTKEAILEQMEKNTYLAQYRAMMGNPNFNIFYNAPCVLLVYGNTASPNHVFDCSLAAQNIMLAAHAMGLATCWIGFAQVLGSSAEIKEELGVPEKYRLVAPLALGWPGLVPPAVPRKEPVFFGWKKN